MITCGIDIGVYATKLVIMGENKIVGWRVIPTGSKIRTTINSTLKTLLNELSLPKIDNFAATGIGRKKVTFASELIQEIIADASGVFWLHPLARTIVDIGAEEARAIKCNEIGEVINYVRNNRCAAGAGVFLESMARALEVSLDELNALALTSKNKIHISSTCSVFSESEVVSLVHTNTAKADIARSICEAIAINTATLVSKLGAEKDVVFIGGVAKNQAVTDELKTLIGIDIMVPQEPQIAGAIGAALMARSGKS